jgi:uncharacterized protein YutE (UPF0331/DUF86 family)
MLDQEKILQFLQQIGPTLPAKVAKNIGSNILIASAHLADLSSQGKIRISNLKVGGSPLYYLAGQEAQIYAYAAGNMNPKDLRVLEKLKQQNVLREEDLDVLSKLALRNLKDFAVPIHVTVGGRKQLFWRYHTLTDEETKEAIKNILSFPQQVEDKIAENEEALAEEIAKEQIPEQSTEEIPVEEEIPEPETSEEPITEIEAPAKEEQLTEEIVEETSIEEEIPEPETSEEPITEIKAPTKEEQLTEEIVEETSVEEEILEPETSEEPITEIKAPTKEEQLTEKIVEEQIPEEPIKEKSKKSKKDKQSTLKKPVLQKIKEKILSKDAFHSEISNHCQQLDILIEDSDVIRKNSEINLTVLIPTPVGSVKFFCKAKSKKRCDEKDLSSAYMEAQIKKLPLLFLYSHEINKKAQDMLDSGAFENVALRKIDNGS